MKLVAALLAVVLLGASSPSAIEPCAGDERWTAAEARVGADDIGAPITGITARLGPLGVDDLDSCHPATVEDVWTPEQGWSGAFVNLSEYDRDGDTRGGNLIQLGVWRRQLGPAAFAFTDDNTNGGVGFLPAPFPEVGHTYVLSITAQPRTWRYTITDAAGRTLHDFTRPAHWSEAQSAWLMVEVFDGASAFRGVELGRMEVTTASETVQAAPDACVVSGVSQEGERYVVTDTDVEGVRCTVAGGTLSAVHAP